MLDIVEPQLEIVGEQFEKGQIFFTCEGKNKRFLPMFAIIPRPSALSTPVHKVFSLQYPWHMLMAP